MKLNKKQIIKIQKNRDPYLLMDYATKVIPGKSVEGYKILKKNEWFFKVHWPGDPNMPGMFGSPGQCTLKNHSFFFNILYPSTDLPGITFVA